MTSFSSDLQSIIDTLRREPLCAVIIDSTGSEPSVDLLFGASVSFRRVHPTVLDALSERGLLPARVIESLTQRGFLGSPGDAT